jgi:vacuolar-type H+-ATPase subunit E/Vma4
MSVSGQEGALTTLVDEYRDQECRHILDHAQQEARQLLSQAYSEAHQRLHRAVAAERSRAARLIQAARAKALTEHRQYRHRINIQWLQVARERLKTELLRRWHDPDSRALWIEALVQQARQRLPLGRWTIAHPPAWPEEERRVLAESLRGPLGTAPEFKPNADVRAGLVISIGGASLDATLEGLLADRARIEARLLCLFEQKELP